MVRPLKEIKWEEVERRIEIGNTARQIAKALRVNIDTFYDRFKQEFGCSFSDYSVGAIEISAANILYTQYMKALGGNTKMLELLGKEICGQGKEESNKVITIKQAEESLSNLEFVQE